MNRINIDVGKYLINFIQFYIELFIFQSFSYYYHLTQSHYNNEKESDKDLETQKVHIKSITLN